MPKKISHSIAREAANAILNGCRRSAQSLVGMPDAQLPAHLGECSATFWWDDSTPLLEFPFLRENGEPAGYAIVSTTRDLPPVLEYAWEGPTASSRLGSALAAHLAHIDLFPTATRWYYWNPVEVVADVSVLEEPGPVYFTLPEMIPTRVPVRIPVRREPRDHWTPESLRRRWDDLLSPQAKGAPVSIGRVLESREPVYYNQNCRAALAEASAGSKAPETDPATYCTPNCIAGCVAVAAAMFASSWKKQDRAGSESRIWPSAICWRIDWPTRASSTDDPDRCTAVNATIWAIHDLLATTCGGNSQAPRLAAAIQRYFRDTWGLSWAFSHEASARFEFFSRTIERLEPLVFMALGQWNAYLQAIAPGLDMPIPAAGKVGHAVLCWGYDAAPWVGGPALYIGLGWGDGWKSRWIEYDSFEQQTACYVSSFG